MKESERKLAEYWISWKIEGGKKTTTYTRMPVTTEAIKVPKRANVTIAPKLEKNGFCKEQESEHNENIKHLISQSMIVIIKIEEAGQVTHRW